MISGAGRLISPPRLEAQGKAKSQIQRDHLKSRLGYYLKAKKPMQSKAIRRSLRQKTWVQIPPWTPICPGGLAV